MDKDKVMEALENTLAKKGMERAGLNPESFDILVNEIATSIVRHLDTLEEELPKIQAIGTTILLAGLSRALAAYVAMTTKDNPKAIKHCMECIGREISTAFIKKREIFGMLGLDKEEETP